MWNVHFIPDKINGRGIPLLGNAEVSIMKTAICENEVPVEWYISLAVLSSRELYWK